MVWETNGFTSPLRNIDSQLPSGNSFQRWDDCQFYKTLFGDCSVKIILEIRVISKDIKHMLTPTLNATDANGMDCKTTETPECDPECVARTQPILIVYTVTEKNTFTLLPFFSGCLNGSRMQNILTRLLRVLGGWLSQSHRVSPTYFKINK